MKAGISTVARKRRHERIRSVIKGTSERPRLCVFRSLNHIYAQAVNDDMHNTIVFASSAEPVIRDNCKGKKKTEIAAMVGEVMAKRALEKNIKKVVFDRGGHKYHGRVKALAEAARKIGLNF